MKKLTGNIERLRDPSRGKLLLPPDVDDRLRTVSQRLLHLFVAQDAGTGQNLVQRTIISVTRCWSKKKPKIFLRSRLNNLILNLRK